MDELHQWIGTLFGSSNQSDIKLHVECVQEPHTFEIPAHGIVIRCASRVFDTMLEDGKFKEGTTGVAQIKVHGNKADAVTFIKYLYTRKLQTLDTNAYVALMRTADVYGMTSLLQMCEKRIRAGLTPFSVCAIYSALHMISSEEFRDYCKDVMLKFAFLIFGETLHITLTEEAMIFLLGSEKLNVLDEEQVLQATWDWGHSKCILDGLVGNKEPKEVVASLLPFIKWSDIDNLKSRSRFLDLHTYFEKSSLTSVTTARKVENDISLSCFANFLNFSQHVNIETCLSCSAPSSDQRTLITFTSDHNVLLTGIEVRVGVPRVTLINYPFIIKVNTIQVQNTSYKSTLLKKTDDPYYYFIFTSDFRTPVLLETKKNHSITLQCQGYSFEVQKLEVKASALQPGILGSDNEVSFSVVGQITGIQKLFYFLQS